MFQTTVISFLKSQIIKKKRMRKSLIGQEEEVF